MKKGEIKQIQRVTKTDVPRDLSTPSKKAVQGIAEKALQAAVRTDSKLKNLQDEKEYTYPSGRVKWEDTIEGWEANEMRKIKENSDLHSFGKDMHEWHKQFKPWVFGGKNENLPKDNNYSSRKENHSSSDKHIHLNDSKEDLSILANNSKQKPPRPSDRKKYQAHQLAEIENIGANNQETKRIAMNLLDVRLLDRMKDSEDDQRTSKRKLENHLSATLHLGNREAD